MTRLVNTFVTKRRPLLSLPTKGKRPRVRLNTSILDFSRVIRYTEINCCVGCLPGGADFHGYFLYYHFI